jgi:small-conductance mechanosensitive channel
MFLTYLLVTVIAIIGLIILMYVSVNLLGMAVRGIYINKNMLRLMLAEDGDTPRDVEYKIKQFTSPRKTVTYLLISAVFYYLLYLFLGIFGALSAFLIMAGRLPDLIWEINHGFKVTRGDSHKGLLHFISSILFLLAFPALWLAIYKLLT